MSVSTILSKTLKKNGKNQNKKFFIYYNIIIDTTKRHFKVVIGNTEHGLYISSSPSSAARKAVSKLCAGYYKVFEKCKNLLDFTQIFVYQFEYDVYMFSIYKLLLQYLRRDYKIVEKIHEKN